jgi:hypothetical protein
MTAGLFIAGSIMLILAAASFQAGGLWIVPGILCLLAWLGIVVYFYKVDQIS